MDAKMLWIFLFSCFLGATVSSEANDLMSEWSYECVGGHCQKIRLSGEDAISLEACNLLCSDYASIWPQPTGKLSFDKSLVQLNVNNIDINFNGVSIKPLVDMAVERFKQNIDLLAPQYGRKSGGKSLIINLNISDTEHTKLAYLQDESYTVDTSMSADDGKIICDIEAKNFFGARHGLETLSQTIIYDDIRGEFQMLDTFYVVDAPVYPHRGISLDTARNYISIDTIKRTIEGMALSKLNIFHWHITDTQSFPFISKSVPQLSKLGAYSPSKIYSYKDIADIIEFGTIRGVKVMPEFDAPAHVGEGWQDTGFLACFNKKPWESFCSEPPCGQLDPTKDEMYNTLELIYKDMIDQFDPDIFHMGGDEVNEDCWRSEESIVNWMKAHDYSIDQAGFMKLWNKFQSEALNRFTKHRGRKVPIILWTSTLTSKKYLEKYLPNDTYIIQLWTKGNDKEIQFILEKGYKTILSNYDALYLDCGFASWVSSGHNWCSPYIGWQKVYENSPAKIAGKYKSQMLGSEAAVWTEQVDDSSVDGRLWPRAAALAERVWAEPTSTWKDAETRMLIHRERLVRLKISSESLEPEWCRQYQGSCPVNGVFN